MSAMIRNSIYLTGMLIWGAQFCCGSDAQAQQLLMPRVGGYNVVQEEPLPHPVVSPYLLMTDIGQSGLLNYQTLVQPLVQQRLTTNHQNASINNLQQQVQSAQAVPKKRPGQNVRDTGHETRYFNYSHYYSSATPR
jgi:hypothetical protein